jgi:hypothetical protein
MNRNYSLTTTTFVALDGGDGYTMLKGARILTAPEQSPLDSEALRRAIAQPRPIAPKIEGRILRLDKAEQTRSGCP